MKAVVFGEVLFDIFPGEKCLGGAPFNFAFHLHGLGVPVVFVSRVGGDELGQSILDYASARGFPVEGIQVDPSHATGEVQVSLDALGNPEFKILRDRAYDYIEQNAFVSSLLKQEPSLIYFGSLAQRNSVSANAIQNFLRTFSGRSTLFMDLNLRAPFYNRGIIESSLEFCDILKVSGEELEELKTILALGNDASHQDIVNHIQSQYKIQWTCVTKGSDGSELYEAGTPAPIVQPASPPERIQDTVGAGDAFSAMLAFGFLNNCPKPLALERASLFASKVCSIKGALPKDSDFYLPFRVEND